ncbi:MAG: hypothetical protein U5K75_06950 [Ahrensia sp.]|nr:hypothetical protein [Ahrensia sp.]
MDFRRASVWGEFGAVPDVHLEGWSGNLAAGVNQASSAVPGTPSPAPGVEIAGMHLVNTASQFGKHCRQDGSAADPAHGLVQLIF